MEPSRDAELEPELSALLAQFGREPPSVASLDDTFPTDVEDPSNWPRGARLLPFVDELPTPTGGEDLAAFASLLNRAALLECARGHFEPAAERARAAVETAATDKTPAAGDPHRTLAVVLHELDRHQAAEAEVELALELHGVEANPAGEAVREDRVVHAKILATLSRLDAARVEAELALAPDEEADRPAAKARAQIAWLLHLDESHEEALEQSRRAIEEIGRTWGTRHPEIVHARIGLGLILAGAGELPRSREELEQTLALAIEIVGEAHPLVDVARSILATTMERQGDHAAAKENFEIALANGEVVLPPDNGGLWYRNWWLSRVLDSLGDGEGSLLHLEKAIRIGESSDFLASDRLADDLVRQGKLLRRLKRESEAYGVLDRARSVASGDGERDAHVRGEAVIEMARMAQARGDLTTARDHFEAAMAAFGAIEEDPVAAGWEQGAGVEMAVVSALIAEKLAASYRTVGLADAARETLDRGRALFVEMLDSILAGANLTGAIAAADAAAGSSVPDVAFRALTQAESLLTTDDDARKRLGGAWHRLGRSLRRQREFDQAMKAFDAAKPLIEADPQFLGVTLHDLAEIHSERAEWKQAIELYREAADLKEKGGDPTGDRASTLIGLGRALLESGDPAGAAETYARARAILDSIPEHDRRIDLLLLEDLGDLRSKEGDLKEAADLFTQAADIGREISEPRRLATTLVALGRVLYAAGDYDEALSIFEEQLGILRALPVRAPVEEGMTLHDMAAVHNARRDIPRATQLLREATDLKRRGEDGPGNLAVTLLSLGRLLYGAGEHEEALAPLAESRDLFRSVEDRRGEANSLYDLGVVNRRLHRDREAIELLRQAETIQRETRATGDLGLTLSALGRAFDGIGEHDRALAAYEEQLSISDDPQARGVALHDIANAHQARGDAVEAVALFREAAAEKQKGGGDRRDLTTTLLALARASRESGDLKGALEALEERLGVYADLPRRDRVGEAETLQEMSAVLADLSRPDRAFSIYQATIAGLREGEDRFGLAVMLLGEARLRLGLRDTAEAARLAEESAGLLRRMDEPDRTQLAAALSILAEVALSDDAPERAIGPLEEANELLDQTGAKPIDVAMARRRLAHTYAQVGDDEKARVWREEARTRLLEGLEDDGRAASMLPILAVIAVDIDAPDLVARITDEARDLIAASPTSQQQKRLLADILRGIGKAYEVTAKDPAAAVGPYRERLRVLEELPQRDKLAEGRAQHDLGGIHRALGQPAEAMAAYRRAADCHREAGNRFAASTSLRYLAELQTAAGDHDAALDSLGERLRLLEEEPPGAERARIELATFERMARVHLAIGDEAEAREHLERASTLRAEGAVADEDIATGLQELGTELGFN